MEKQQIIEILKQVKEKSPARNFTQTYDMVINLKDIDIKKPDQKVDLFIALPFPHLKKEKTKLCAFVDHQLLNQVKNVFDTVILKDEFSKYAADKKAQRKLARSYIFFVAQANLMKDVAAAFGKTLGTKGLMPNPKAGCIITLGATNLEQLTEKLRKTIRLQTKNEPIVKVPVGNFDMPDEEVAQNTLAVYTNLMQCLPQGKNNIKSLFIKLSMGPVFRIADKEDKDKLDKEKTRRKKPIIQNERP